MPSSSEDTSNAKRQPDAAGRNGQNREAHEAARGKKRARPPKRSISQLSRKELDDDEFDRALAMINKESDRGAAIMGAALVEDGLIAVLDAKLESGQDRKAIYESPNSPLGTFSNKTIMAIALGLCDDVVGAEINAIRSIRNQFSHALRAIDFRNEDIRTECAKLRQYKPVELEEGVLPDPTQPRFRYVCACAGIWMILYKRANQLQEERLRQMRSKTSTTLNALIGGTLPTFTKK